MSVPMHLAPFNVQLVELIAVEAVRGTGTPENPERMVIYYYHPKDGRLMALTDTLHDEIDRLI